MSRVVMIIRQRGAKGDPGINGGTAATSADFLAYLQGLPTTLPDVPNMPWWDDNVFKRSAALAGAWLWEDDGTWNDSEMWSEN
jgi:hypothetical protein